MLQNEKFLNWKVFRPHYLYKARCLETKDSYIGRCGKEKVKINHWLGFSLTVQG